MYEEDTEVFIPIERDVQLAGDLTLVPGSRAMILFAHGSGSSRHSPRNRQVARRLREAGLSTLLMDLLTEPEERSEFETAHLRFDIGLLASRLAAATDWLQQNPETSGSHVGYFGASTGAAAALVAAADRPAVGAIVSRGGRPDLAGDALARVQAPTLLVVGGHDVQVLQLNRQAFDRLGCEKRLEIIAHASHLFEESGALDKVADVARAWFQLHLAGRSMPARPV